MQPPFQLRECRWALGKVGRATSPSQNFPLQSSGPCSHLLLLLPWSLLISHLHIRIWRMLRRTGVALQLSCRRLWKLGLLGSLKGSLLLNSEAKGLNRRASQLPKYHFPPHKPAGLLHLHKALQGRQLQKACTEDAFLRWLRHRTADTARSPSRSFPQGAAGEELEAEPPDH